MNPLKVTTLHLAASRRIHCIEDIRRAPRAADRDQEISRTCMQLDLLGENLIIAQVISETSEHRAVIECERTDIAILRIIGRHMAGNCGAAAVADEYELVAGCVGAAGIRMT